MARYDSVTLTFEQAAKIRTGKQLQVYMLLRSFQGRNKNAWPGQAAIIQRANEHGIKLTKTRLSQVVSELVQLGLVKSVRRGRARSNVYVCVGVFEFRNPATQDPNEFRNPATPEFRNPATPCKENRSKKTDQLVELGPERLFGTLKAQISSGSLEILKRAYVSHNGTFVFDDTVPQHLRTLLRKTVPVKFQKQNTKKRAKKLAR